MPALLFCCLMIWGVRNCICWTIHCSLHEFVGVLTRLDQQETGIVGAHVSVPLSDDINCKEKKGTQYYKIWSYKSRISEKKKPDILVNIQDIGWQYNFNAWCFDAKIKSENFARQTVWLISRSTQHLCNSSRIIHVARKTVLYLSDGSTITH